MELMVKEETEINQEPYKCSQSELVLSNNINRISHLRTENGKKKLYQCSQCHKDFSHKSNLATHLRTHGGKHINAGNVTRLSQRMVILQNILRRILGTNHINVATVTRLSQRIVILQDI